MNKVYLNIDVNSVNCPYLDKVIEKSSGIISEDMLYPFVDIYKSTYVTDILFNIFAQIPLLPSKYFRSMTEYAEQDKKEYKCYKTLYYEHNIDPFEVWINRCTENGHNPWISIRMNDCHPSPFLENDKSSFLSYAIENGMTLGEEYGYFKNCYNYRFKEVRDKMLSYIREQLEKYDVYGLELDFMRECQCFKYLTDDMDECTEIMNEFMRNVKKITSDIEKKVGHKIKICVRVMRDIIHSKYYGFDPQSWEKEALVDVINPTARWSGGDSGIPVSQWKALLPNTEIAPGIETAAISYSPDRGMAYSSAEIARGLAASMLSQGASSLYFFNYMVNPEEDIAKDSAHVLAAHGKTRNLSVLSSCSNFASIYNHPVRFAILPQTDEAFAKFPPMWQPIPVNIKPDTKERFEITTGKIPKNKQVYLVIGSFGDISSCTVTFNGNECTTWRNADLSFLPGIGTQPSNYVSEGTVCKICTAEKLNDFKQNLCVKSNSADIQICWIEILVF